jgi:uncharacterized membrane protein
MRILKTVGAAGLLVLTLSAAKAASLWPVPYPPSTDHGGFVTGINDSNTIAGGFYTADGIEHAFFGPLHGGVATIWDVGKEWTEARGINNDGTVVGYYDTKAPNVVYGYQFERYTNSAVKPIKNGDSFIDGIVESINSKGIFIGESWNDTDDTVTAYEGKKAKYKVEVDPAISGDSFRGRGINKAGDMVGYFTNTHVHGFLIHNGVTTQIDFPGARDTRLESINNKGVMSGYWTPDGTVFHAFYYDPNKSLFSQVDIDGSGFTTGFGINRLGNLMINSDFGFFVFCPKSRNCRSDSAETAKVAKVTEVHVDPSSFLRFGDIRAIKTTPPTPHMEDGEHLRR